MLGVRIQDTMFILWFSSTLIQFKQMITDVECCVFSPSVYIYLKIYLRVLK